MNINKKILNNLIKKIKTIFSALILIFIIPILFLLPTLVVKFTPAETLTQRYLAEEYPKLKSIKITEDTLIKHIYENSKYNTDGAICGDGWVSSSTGRGTCSHHGGVNYWYKKGEYSKTRYEARDIALQVLEKAKQKALKKSWVD